MSFDSQLPAGAQRARELMAGYERPWALCGGWAADLWLGKQTRDHGDLDIAVFEPDTPVFFRHFEGWTLNADDATNGMNREQWDGRTLVLPAHIHARSEDGDVELIVNPGNGKEWVVMHGEPGALPFEDVVVWHGSGLPLVRPELLMFYKSRVCNGCPGCSAPRTLRPHDEADFRALLPTLSGTARAWLRAAIEPDHPWRALL